MYIVAESGVLINQLLTISLSVKRFLSPFEPVKIARNKDTTNHVER